MKKLLFAAVLPLTLASCGLFGTPKGDVTGTISNAPTGEGTIRMGIRGVDFGGVTNTSEDYLTVVPNKKGLFGMGLPAATTTGAYKVYAYADKNGNGKYDSGESITKDNGKMLVFIANDFTGDVLGGVAKLGKGWNLIEGTTLTQVGAPFKNYNLTF